LRCDHPDLEEFIHAKDAGDLANFNILGRRHRRLHAGGWKKDQPFELVHKAKPWPGEETYQRADGLWVYRKIRAAPSCGTRSCARPTTTPSPGSCSSSASTATTTSTTGETSRRPIPAPSRPLPPYGCCCLGSIDLTKYVSAPFTEQAKFDFERFARTVEVSVRMLDNVLEVTAWPLEQQRKEAMAKRRVGLGFTGLGDALIMLRLRYDTTKRAGHGGDHLGGDARCRLPRLGRAGTRARAVPAL